MFGHVGRYLAMREKAKDLPEEEVTEEKFIVAMMAEGATEKQAKDAAWFSRKLGSSAQVGTKMLRIVGGKDEKV